MKARRDLACEALWSDTHPLSQLFAIANGRWIGDRFEPARAWSIKQLIAFTESLPQPIVDRIARRRK